MMMMKGQVKELFGLDLVKCFEKMYSREELDDLVLEGVNQEIQLDNVEMNNEQEVIEID